MMRISLTLLLLVMRMGPSRQDTEASGRISGGTVSRRGQFGFMAHLIGESGNESSVGGGALLNQQEVLTVHHIFDKVQ